MNRRVLLAGVAGAVVVLLLWYVFFWSPQSRAIADARERREAAERLEGELRARLSRLREAKRVEATTRSQIDALRVAVPDQPNLAQLILDANDAATRSGIDFLSISPTPPSAPGAATTGAAGTAPDTAPGTAPGATPATGTAGRPSEIRLAMTITGGYFQVLDFINRLDALPRLVVIDSLNVTAGGETGGLSVQLQARMFTNAAPAGTAGRSAGAATAGGAAGGAGTAPGATTATTAAPAPTTPTTVAR